MRVISFLGRAVYRGSRHVRFAIGTAVLCSAAPGCSSPRGANGVAVMSRYRVEAEPTETALVAWRQRIRSSVAASLGDGVLEEGFPRACTVTLPDVRTEPFTPECVEGGASPDGLLLDATGRFVQFEGIDYLSARAVMFRVYLIPPGNVVERPEDLVGFPYIAIPHVPLSETTYRAWLSAIERGIRAAGAEPF